MFVSEIGKTALANTLIGQPFTQTDSTIGINELKCDIKYAKVGAGMWSAYKKPEKEMEAAIADMIANGPALEKPKTELEAAIDDMIASQSAKENKVDDSAPIAVADTPVLQDECWNDNPQMTALNKSSSLGDVAAETKGADKEMCSKNGNSELGKYMQERVHGYTDGTADTTVALSADEAKRFDDELVMRCLADKMATDSKFIISLFDFGGQSVFNVRKLLVHDTYRCLSY